MMGKTNCVLHPKLEYAHQCLLIIALTSFNGLQFVELNSKLQADLLPASRDVVGKVEALVCWVIDYGNTEVSYGWCFTTEIFPADVVLGCGFRCIRKWSWWGYVQLGCGQWGD